MIKGFKIKTEKFDELFIMHKKVKDLCTFQEYLMYYIGLPPFVFKYYFDTKKIEFISIRDKNLSKDEVFELCNNIVLRGYSLLDVESYIIIVEYQDLDKGIIWKGNIGEAINTMSKEDVVKDLQNNGLEIVKSTNSSFGACYFFEVKGDYKGNIPFSKSDIKSKDFDWNI